MNGNREQTNNYTIDGVDMNESIDNLVAYQPSPDALAQISVETNNYAADTGNVAGAVISNVIKSGSNQFHGNAFEYYRNSSMDANSWSNNRSRAAKPERRQDIYGGTFGGPLMKNKLFFFGNYQGTRIRCARVRDDFGRAGYLAARRSVEHDHRAQGSGRPASRSPATRFPRAGSVRIASGILNNLALYPLPNRTVTGVTGNYVGETLTTIRANQGDGRVDWSLSTNDKIFGRFSIAEYESTEQQARDSAAARQPDDRAVPQRGASTGTASSSRRSSTKCSFGYNRITIVSDTLDWAGIGDANATFGIAGRPADSGPQLDRVGQRAHRHSARALATPTPSTRPIRSTRSSRG